jgi:hypothetical protein
MELVGGEAPALTVSISAPTLAALLKGNNALNVTNAKNGTS